MSSPARIKQPSYIDKIRQLTHEVNQQEGSCSEKCKKIKSLVEPIHKKNGSTTTEEYRETIIKILDLLSNGQSEETRK